MEFFFLILFLFFFLTHFFSMETPDYYYYYCHVNTSTFFQDLIDKNMSLYILPRKTFGVGVQEAKIAE